MYVDQEPKTDLAAPCCSSLRIGGVLALALAVRLLIPLLGWLFVTPAPLVREPDSESYLHAAEKLGRSDQQHEPELVRTPGYPLLLKLGIWLKHVDLTTILLQIGLGCLTTFLVYRLSQSVFERNDLATAAALLYACEPVSALYCSKLLGETLFTAVLTLSLWLLCRWVRQPGWGNLLWAAAAQAYAIFIRPVAYVLPLVLACTLVAVLWKRGPSRRELLSRAGAFLLLSMASAWAWQARNYFTADYVQFSAISDINLYYYQAAAVLAQRRGVSLQAMQRELGYFDDDVYFACHPDQRSWTQAERYAYIGREGRRIIAEHPALMLRIQLQGAAALLLDPGVSAYLGFFRLDKAHTESGAAADKTAEQRASAPRSMLMRVMHALREKPLVVALYGALSLVWLIYAALAVRGLLAKSVWQSPCGWLVLSAAAALILLSGGPVGYHRFRLPVMPEICLLAGCGAVRLRETWDRIGARRNAVAR